MDKRLPMLTSAFVSYIRTLEDQKIPSAVKEYVTFLSEQKLLGAWREVERLIHSAWKEQCGVSKVTIVSAHPLSEEANAAVEEMARGADIERRVDERLIGGAVIRLDDRRIDGSVAGALQKLKMTLSK